MIMLGNGRILGNQRQHSASGLKNVPLGTLAQASGHGVRSGSSLIVEPLSSAPTKTIAANREIRHNQLADRASQLKERIKNQESLLKGVAKLKYGPIVESIAEELNTKAQNTEEITKSLERHAANLSQISGPLEEIGISTAPRDGKGLILYDQAIEPFN